ncbi:MAG TPA: mannose-1-phosphate guanylyltransferase [Flavobacteriaceae bacterium]|nr:mannose-1-phosphate guanylyltransferase [Flavobacteriaceae bacterium]
MSNSQSTNPRSTNHYAVIMAGGVGSRFWPVSTEEFPKQFHDMLGTGKSLLQQTFERISKIVPAENILILTNDRYENLVKQQLPKIENKRIFLEPAMRNTAPCILLSAMKIRQENPDAVMLVAPSDHWIEDETAFSENILTAFQTCQNENILMTLGIQPAFPNTGYGYIQFEKSEKEIKKVSQFTEKPDYQTAKTFLEAGNYLWNAGIFSWSVKTIIAEFKTQLPEMYELFSEGKEILNTEKERKFIAENYAKAENISIDYGIMEKAKNVGVLPASFDWNDLGTWGSLHNQLPKDDQNNAVVNGKSLLLNSENNMIRLPEGKVIVAEGLHNFIVIDKEDVLLIIPKKKEQEIKEIRNQSIKKFGENLG